MAILNGFLNSKREFCCCFVVVILGPLNRTSHFRHIDIAKKKYVFVYNLSIFYDIHIAHIGGYVNSAKPYYSLFRFHSEIMWNHSCKSGCQLFTVKLLWRRKANTLLEEKAYQKIKGEVSQNRFICQISTNRRAISIGSIHLGAQRSAFEWDVCLFCLFIFMVRVTMFCENDERTKTKSYDVNINLVCYFVLSAIMPLLTTAATLPSLSTSSFHPPVVVSKFKLKTAHTCAKPIFKAVLAANHTSRANKYTR